MGQIPAALKHQNSSGYVQAEDAKRRDKRIRGRGALSNAPGRFEPHQRQNFDDGWGTVEEEQGRQRTQVHIDSTKTIIAKNTSPDIPFDKSINAYRGCEHGCVYCFARPSHSFLGHSPGLDFEEQLYAKPNAADLLRAELSAPGYKVSPIALGTNTDPYQPIEQRYKITRSILEVLLEARHPVTIVTKSHSVTRDIDIIQKMAELDLIKVALSVTTLDHKLARLMEPRASTPARRLDAISDLAQAGVKTAIMFAPVIPALNDHELEWVLAAAADAGAAEANYITLRLPLEVKDLFHQWLRQHYPDRAAKIINILASMRGGKLNDPRFGNRMKGNGAYALMLAKRFRLAAKRYGLQARSGPINTSSFTPQNTGPVQLSLL